MRILNAAQMREADRFTIEDIGIPSLVLMENAGRQVVAALEAAYEERLEGRVAVLCGRGNNGGDGFVVARRLASTGRAVLAIVVGDAGKLHGTAATHNWNVLQAMASAGSLELFVAPTPELLLRLRERIAEGTLIVDALLGSGASGPLREPISSAVDLVNAARAHASAAGRPFSVVAVDAPTRIDLTGGGRSTPVVTADVTVTFHRAKAGFALDREARRLAGRYLVAPIGIPLEAEEGIVPPDGAWPPARITEVTWEEPVERPDAANRAGGGIAAGPGRTD
jgi:NAD(P)H-hydrate epimerase